MHKLKSLKDIYRKYMLILTSSQKKWGVVVILLTIIGSICELLGVSVILPLVQVMIEPQKLRENRILNPLIRYWQLNSTISLIWVTGILVILVYIIKNLFLFLLSYVRVKYACKVQRELSVEMMDSYMKQGYVFFLDIGIGELLRGIEGSIDNVYVALYQLFRILAEMLTIVLICIYIIYTDVAMALGIMVLAFVGLMLVEVCYQKWVKKSGEIFHHCSMFVKKAQLQAFQGIKEILAMQRQEYFVNTYRKSYSARQKGTIGQSVATESPTYVIEAICVLGLIIVVCLKAINVKDTSILIPQLASFAVAAFRILPSLGRISNYFNQFMFCIPGINDTYNNLKKARNSNAQVREESSLRQIVLGRFKSKLSIENISWKYPNTDDNVLKDISIEINQGQSVAFVGKSGAGKTTLADIVLGLLEPQSGKVKIDGVDIFDIPKERSMIMGFVPQNVYLLDDTVRRNVAFGIEDEKIDDTLVWKALEQAQMKEIIENNVNGLDAEIGERGIRFSGGQRQRFAVARALYNDPDILILDEATSALDTETETAVMEAIEALQGHKTLIIIAHRLSTIRNCDKIYEIVDGKAIERTYEELKG